MFDHTLPTTAVIEWEGLHFMLRRCHSQKWGRKQWSSATDFMKDQHLWGAPQRWLRETGIRKKGSKEEWTTHLYHSSYCCTIMPRATCQRKSWTKPLSKTVSPRLGTDLLVNCQIPSHVCTVFLNSMTNAWRILNLHIHHLVHWMIRDIFKHFTFFAQLNRHLL